MTPLLGHFRLVAFGTLFLLTWVPRASAALPADQLRSLYSAGNEAFGAGNAEMDPTQRRIHYDRAILRFERVIREGEIENSKLYYNLANACLLNDQIGKAILNYRRAQGLDGADTNIQKNLAFARNRRIDTLTVQAEKKVLQTLFFWHYDLPLPSRVSLMFMSFGTTCAMGIVMILRGYRTQRAVVCVLGGIVVSSLLVSVVIETTQQSRTAEGVILAAEVIARQGDGDNYPPSFKGALHAGTEFVLLESRSSWLQIRLSDGSEGWIPSHAAESI